MTTMEIAVADGTAEGARLMAALKALGAKPVREGGTIRATVPAAPCVFCSQICARHEMEEVPRLGGLTCPVCKGIAGQIMTSARRAAQRHLDDIARQLPQMVRDIRGGAEVPTFYAGYPG